MAAPGPSTSDFPTFSVETVRSFAGATFEPYSSNKLSDWLKGRLAGKEYTDTAVSELVELTSIGTGSISLDVAKDLRRSEKIRAVATNTVLQISKLLVSHGFSTNCPLAVSVRPIIKKGSKNKTPKVPNYTAVP